MSYIVTVYVDAPNREVVEDELGDLLGESLDQVNVKLWVIDDHEYTPRGGQ